MTIELRRLLRDQTVVLGATQAALVVAIIVLNLDRIPKIIGVCRALSEGF